MDAFLKTIGVIVVSAIIVAIPLLCGLSFALSWSGGIQWLLIIGISGVFCFVAFNIADKSSDGK